jgi:hypothetical protein
MSLSFASTKPWVSAVGEIADTVGASAQGAQTDRAHKSLVAAFQYFNGKKWEFLTTEATPIPVQGPFAVSITASSGQVTAVTLAGHGVKIDDLLVGDGFTLGTRVTATAASSISFNVSVSTAAGAQSYDITAQRAFYDLPSDFKVEYSVQLLNSNRTLQQVRRRARVRGQDQENVASTPSWYDIYSVGQKGKIRLVPDPGGSDTLQLGYYRRMAVGSASGDSTTLDIPIDYEPYVIAWGKWHYLIDKSEGRSDQATTWLALATEGIKTMIADQTNHPDEGLGFTPGHWWGTMTSPNDVRPYLYDP